MLKDEILPHYLCVYVFVCVSVSFMPVLRKLLSNVFYFNQAAILDLEGILGMTVENYEVQMKE